MPFRDDDVLQEVVKNLIRFWAGTDAVLRVFCEHTGGTMSERELGAARHHIETGTWGTADQVTELGNLSPQVVRAALDEAVKRGFAARREVFGLTDEGFKWVQQRLGGEPDG
jgi:hypothetical protein